MSKLIEHELAQLHGQEVCVVRPHFGDQSESWTGYLSVNKSDYPYQFHLSTAFYFAMIFTADDVVRIDPPQYDSADNNLPIIRLKGPADYTKPYQQVPTLDS